MATTVMTKVAQDAVLVEKVFQRRDFALFIALSVFSIAAIVDFLTYWFSYRDWMVSPVVFSVLTVLLFVTLLSNQGRWFLLPRMRRPRPTAVAPGLRVGVATTFVPGLEPLEMLEETVQALVAMDYPHDTWVLDEGGDEEVKALCGRLGANYFSRNDLPHYKTESGTFQSNSKHGNYNAWFYEIGFARYDIVTAIDPDHVPRPDFLTKVLGYFKDPRVAYVQAAQDYYNDRSSFIARGAAEESYAFYSCDQMVGYGMGFPVLIGCHNTHRVTALKEMGGFPAHDAEDLFLTALYRGGGWNGVYVPEILASGLTPVDWSGYLGLQRRWARSVLDMKLRQHRGRLKGLSFGAKTIGYLQGINFLYRNLALFSVVILVAFMLATGRSPAVISFELLPRGAILLAVLQLCELYRRRFYLNGGNEWGLHWRAGLLQLAKWPYFLLAFYDVLSGRRIPYVLTPKVGRTSKRFMLLWPHMLVVVSIGVAWVVGICMGHTPHLLLHLCAAVIVGVSLGLIWTERMRFPEPYAGPARSRTVNTARP